MAMEFRFDATVIRVNVPDMDALVSKVAAAFAARAGFALCTINLDHIVKLRSDRAFRAAYAAHDLVLADGNPIVWLSRLAGRPVQLLPGSEMIEPLCELAAQAGIRVAFVGATDASLADAAEALKTRFPDLDVALRIAPSSPFDPAGTEAAGILEQLDARNIGLCLLALGAPRQEMLAARGREIAPRCGFASIGAGLDFIGGHQTRAPAWARGLALEWLWRALTSPRRLGPRYLRCAMALPGQMIAALGLRNKG